VSELFRAPADVENLAASVKLCLRGFDIDRNPVHVFNAWRVVRQAGLYPSGELLNYMDRALEKGRFIGFLGKRGAGRTPEGTLREVRMHDAVLELTGCRELPQVLPPDIRRQLAERFSLSLAAVSAAFDTIRRRVLRAGGRLAAKPKPVLPKRLRQVRAALDGLVDPGGPIPAVLPHGTSRTIADRLQIKKAQVVEAIYRLRKREREGVRP
jgi:hypothetical protein